jgi:ribosomal protein S18 acetylase RimI-like enzyme
MHVVYKINSASIEDVSLHLRRCDGEFVPCLSSRVDIDEYAVKIFERSKMYEAWSEGELLGLVAVYCNSTERLSAFVSNVSVIPGWHRKGIANNLINQSMLEVNNLGFKSIQLEVRVENEIAISFYSKKGFTFLRRNGPYLIMNINFET